MENQDLEDKIKSCVNLIGEGKLDESKVREYNQICNEIKELETRHYREEGRLWNEHSDYLKNVIWPRKDQRYTLEEIEKLREINEANLLECRNYNDEIECLVNRKAELRKPLERVIGAYSEGKRKLEQDYSWKLESIDRQIKNAEQKIRELKCEKENTDKTYKTEIELIDERLNALNALW